MKLAAGSDRHSIAKCGSEDGQPPLPLPSPGYTWYPLLIDYSLNCNFCGGSLCGLWQPFIFLKQWHPTEKWQLEGFVEGWRECQCLFKRQKLKGLHVVSDLQLYLKNLSMMCTPFIRNGYTFYWYANWFLLGTTSPFSKEGWHINKVS